MGRKRKAGSIPSPLVPSLPTVARPESSAGRRKTKKARGGGGGGGGCPKEHRHPGGETAERTTPTAPTGSSRPPIPRSGPAGISSPPDDAIRALLSPPTSPEAPASSAQHEGDRSASASSRSNNAAQPPASSVFEGKPGESHDGNPTDDEPGLTPSGAIGLLRASGWRLGSCWGAECGCSEFKPTVSAIGTTLTLACACGHRSCAHELVDANDDAGEVPLPLQPNRHQQRWQYRYYPGDGDTSSAAAAALETGVRLRRLFSAIRNARAVGDCGLFEDSEGVRGWGSGWFLSRCVCCTINPATYLVRFASPRPHSSVISSTGRK